MSTPNSAYTYFREYRQERLYKKQNLCYNKFNDATMSKKREKEVDFRSASTTREPMTKDMLIGEFKKCITESNIIAYVTSAIGMLIMAGYIWLEWKAAEALMGVALFLIVIGVIMIWRARILKMRIKNESFISAQLAAVNSGGITPMASQKKWRIRVLIVAAVVVIIALIFILIDGKGSSGDDVTWQTCLKCGGDGKVASDVGINVTCPRCDGVGKIPS